MLTQFNDVLLRTRRALSLNKVYGINALLVLNKTWLNSINALLVLSRRYMKFYNGLPRFKPYILKADVIPHKSFQILAAASKHACISWYTGRCHVGTFSTWCDRNLNCLRNVRLERVFVTSTGLEIFTALPVSATFPTRLSPTLTEIVPSWSVLPIPSSQSVGRCVGIPGDRSRRLDTSFSFPFGPSSTNSSTRSASTRMPTLDRILVRRLFRSRSWDMSLTSARKNSRSLADRSCSFASCVMLVRCGSRTRGSSNELRVLAWFWGGGTVEARRSLRLPVWLLPGPSVMHLSRGDSGSESYCMDPSGVVVPAAQVLKTVLERALAKSCRRYCLEPDLGLTGMLAIPSSEELLSDLSSGSERVTLRAVRGDSGCRGCRACKVVLLTGLGELGLAVFVGLEELGGDDMSSSLCMSSHFWIKSLLARFKK